MRAATPGDVRARVATLLERVAFHQRDNEIEAFARMYSAAALTHAVAVSLCAHYTPRLTKLWARKYMRRAQAALDASSRDATTRKAAGGNPDHNTGKTQK